MSQDIINKNQDISYTNLDFSSIYTEVVDLAKRLSYRWDPSISDESDPGVVLLKLSALIADKMNYNIDKSALESFPVSVTQEGSAKQLYEQLGYYMNWYESASTLINLSWIGEVPSDEETIVYTIPKFTVVTDSESSKSYAIIGTLDSNGLVVSDIKLPRDRSIVQAVVLEGTPVRYSFLGETVITSEMLDENNRLYLDTQYVSQNGIFIRNSGNDQDNFLEWKRVDNLYEQPYNDLRYKLGIDSNTNVAYLEFPDNYAELIGAGIEITYMVIDPEFADIPTQTLDRFLVTVNPVEDVNTYLSFENVKIENIYASSGHKNKETIDEAYTNYKRTVGTFRTLITLRDYLNFILTEGEELCSNGFVTDRTNDPQLSYQIMSKLNGLDSLITEVESIDNYENVDISQEDYKPNKYYKHVDSAYTQVPTGTPYNSKTTYYIYDETTQKYNIADITEFEEGVIYYTFAPAHMEIDGSEAYDSNKMYFLPKSEDKLTPFSLKFYLLQDAIAVNSKVNFEQTFNMIATEDLPSIDALLEDTSHIQHTYEDILPLGENTYKKTEDTQRLTTKSYYHYDKATQRYEFISNSYYKMCDSNVQHPFVYINVIEDDFVSNKYFWYNSSPDPGKPNWEPCKTWNNNIFKPVEGITEFESNTTYYTLNDRTYQVATVFEEGVQYYIAALYTPGTFYLYNKEYDYYYTYEMPLDPTTVNPYLLKLYTLEDLTDVDNINPKSQGWYEIDIEALSPHVAYFRAKYPLNMDITTYSVVGTEVQSDIKSNVLMALYENLNSTQIEFGDKIELDYLTEIVLKADSRIKSVVFANIEYRIEAMYYNPIHGFIGVILPTEISAPTYSDETSVISYNICKDIFAKSILAGRTKLLDKDTQFEYHLNQSYLDTVNDIYSIKSEAVIDMKNVASVTTGNGYVSKNYTLKENETLTLLQPQLSNIVSYEKGVHFEYLIFNDITAGDSYELSTKEYMILYTSVLDENDELKNYKCNVYTNGAIIKPSFDLPAQSNQSYLSQYFITQLQPNMRYTDETSYEYTTDSSYWTTYIQNDSAIINNEIVASDDITIQNLAKVTIEPSDGYRFYWVLNREQKAESTGKKFYQLFDSYDSNTQKKQNALINTYTLKTGEAFYYMDKDAKHLAVLHAGDTIVRNTGASSEFIPVDSKDLFTFIPVISENTKIDLAGYKITFIQSEEGVINPSLNGFYEGPSYELISPTAEFDSELTYYIYNNESDSYTVAEISKFEFTEASTYLEGTEYYIYDEAADKYLYVHITEFEAGVTYYTRTAYYTYQNDYVLTEDTEVDISKTYYALIMNSTSGYFEQNDEVYSPSPSTTYNVFKSIGELEDGELSNINPSSDEYSYFEKVTSQGIEIEDTYAAGNDVEITYEVSEETSEGESPTKEWSMTSGDLEESVVTRPRFKHVSATSLLTEDISLGEINSFKANDTLTYPASNGINIDNYSSISYSPRKNKLYEVSEYTRVNITEFEDGVTYYTYDDTNGYEEVPSAATFDEDEIYYTGPEFYDFYVCNTDTAFERTYISSSAFDNRATHPYKYYIANRTYTKVPVNSTFNSSYIYYACVERQLTSPYSPLVYTPLTISQAQPGITYFYELRSDSEPQYAEYNISPGDDIPSYMTLYVKGYDLNSSSTSTKYIPINNITATNFSDYVSGNSNESYLATSSSPTYTIVADAATYITTGEYYVSLNSYSPVLNVSLYNIPTAENWYERDDFDASIHYYVYNPVIAGFQEVYIDSFSDGIEYYYLEDDVYYSIYYLSSKVYTYKPNSVISSNADTPFVALPENTSGGLGCYYKVGAYDTTYIKNTTGDEHIALSATNNDLPTVLYNAIRTNRLSGMELNTITLASVDSIWDTGKSTVYPSDFCQKTFIVEDDNPQYYGILLDQYMNTIRSVLTDIINSTSTVFPYSGTIGSLTGSFIIVDAQLYSQITQKLPNFDGGIGLVARGYQKLTSETLRTWYTIVESLVGLPNRAYVCLYFIPQHYKFRYLYNTNANNYYMLKTYVDKEFGTIDPWECDSLTSDLIASNPAQALNNMWKPLQDNCSITVRVNNLYTLTEGDTITLTSKVDSNAITWPTFTNNECILNYNNYDTSYTTTDNNVVSLDNISIKDSEWRAYSNLLINTSTGKGQQLASNHVVTFYDRNEEELLSIPSGLNDYSAKDITMFQLEHPINNVSGEYIQAITLDDLGNEVLNSAYIYKQLLSHNHKDTDENKYDVRYSSDNNTNIVLYNTGDVNVTAELPFVMPQGKYLLPMQGIDGVETYVYGSKNNPVVPGYFLTTDTELNAEKEYVTLDISLCENLTKFEEDVDYYVKGVPTTSITDSYGKINTTTEPEVDTTVDYYNITPHDVNPSEAYAVFDSSDNSLTFFRDEPGKYTNGQIVESKTYYTGIETTNYNSPPWSSHRSTIQKVVFTHIIKPISTSHWFYYCQALTQVDISYLDTSQVTDMSYMFDYCQALTQLDVSHFDTSKVNNMDFMFAHCSNLNAAINIMNMPNTYDSMFGESATKGSAQIKVYYISPVTRANVNTLISTSQNDDPSITSNVINAGDGEFIEPSRPRPPVSPSIHSNLYYEPSATITIPSRAISLYDYTFNTNIFDKSKIYYLYIDNQDASMSKLVVNTPKNTSETVLTFGDLFKYENVYDDFIHGELLEKIIKFDKDTIFNYTYQPADNELIENPVEPKSFWDKNHVYNPYTIAQLNTSSTDNINYRFITSR